MQFSGDHFAGGWLRTRFAIAESGTVIRAHARKFRDLRLHFEPRKIGVAQARVENHRGTSLSRAVNVHSESAHVKPASSHGIEAPVASLKNILVDHSGDGEEEHEGEQGEDEAAKPRMSRRR